MKYTFQSVSDEKEMVKAVLDAPFVITMPEYFDLYVGDDKRRFEVIDWLKVRKIDYQNFTCFVRVMGKPGRLYKVLGALVQRFPFFIYI